MVDKKLVRNIINDVIDNKVTKCSNNKIPSNPNSFGVRFNKKVRKSLDDFRNETCGDNPLKKEKLHLINENGEVVYTKYGNSASVSPNHDKVFKARDENGMLHLTHNHPLGKNEELPYKIIPTMLSEPDARSLLETGYYHDGRFESMLGDKWDYTYKSITAESPNGSRITLMKNNDFTFENETDFMNTYTELNNAWQGYVNNFKNVKRSIVAQMNGGDWFKDYYHLKGKSDEEVISFIDNLVVKEIGGFEDSLTDVRRRFNDCNVELSIEWR